MIRAAHYGVIALLFHSLNEAACSCVFYRQRRWPEEGRRREVHESHRHDDRRWQGRSRRVLGLKVNITDHPTTSSLFVASVEKCHRTTKSDGECVSRCSHIHRVTTGLSRSQIPTGWLRTSLPLLRRPLRLLKSRGVTYAAAIELTYSESGCRRAPVGSSLQRAQFC